MEPPQRGRQEVGAGSRAGADREGARPKPAHLARRLLGGAQQREGLARVWLYRARRRSRPYALPVTLDEPDTKVGFESDRKSTRLNSSHRTISYAVFCLKKKK